LKLNESKLFYSFQKDLVEKTIAKDPEIEQSQKLVESLLKKK